MQEFPAGATRLAPRDILTGAPPGDSLENVQTFDQADGCLCWVINQQADYRLLKSSVAAAAPPNVIVPSIGPGRWFRVSGPGGGILSCVRRTTDLTAASVAMFTTILSTIVASGTGKIAVVATMSIDIATTDPIGEGVFRLVVDSIVLPAPLAGAAQSTSTGANDHCISLSGCTTVVPGLPHTIELQWMSGTPATTLALEPMAEPDEEHATIIVWEVP